MSKKRIIVKIGSSLLTEASGKLSVEKLDNHAAAIAAVHEKGHEVVLVTSGAIAAGFEHLGFSSRPKGIVPRQACAAIGQGLLIHSYAEAFHRRGISTAQVLLTRRDFAVRESYNNAFNTLTFLLERRIVPIINENDTTAIEELSFGDNDFLAALVTALLHGDFCVILTDTAGLYDSDPSISKDARPIARVEKLTPEIMALASGSASKVGTGGMRAKLRAAEFALSMGNEVFIGDGKGSDENKIVDVIEGKGKGTYFGNGNGEQVKRKKQWIAFHSAVEGAVRIDDGAVRALVDDGRSLLPAGVLQVDGEFRQSAVIEVRSKEGVLIGKGIVNYAASKLREVMQHSTEYAKQHLDVQRVEVIHRDDWVNLLKFHIGDADGKCN